MLVHKQRKNHDNVTTELWWRRNDVVAVLCNCWAFSRNVYSSRKRRTLQYVHKTRFQNPRLPCLIRHSDFFFSSRSLFVEIPVILPLCLILFIQQNILHFLLAHLELYKAPGQLMPWPVVRPSLAFHIFDISSRIISWIELKLNGMYCGNMEIQHCQHYSVTISKMAAGHLEIL